MSVRPSLSLALRHFRRALSRWPEDKLRPDISFAKTILEAKQARLQPGSTKPPESPIGAPTSVKAAQAESSQGESVQPTVQPAPADPAAELEQVNALYSLLENRYTDAYKVSERMWKPTGAPEHYERLLREMQDAPQRSWVGRVLKRWSGIIRWK